MRRIQNRLAVPFVFCLSLAAMLAAPAQAAVHCVNVGGTGGCQATIQAAVDASGHLDVIQVAAGTYNEHVTMPSNRSISINGAGPEKTIVDGFGVGEPRAAVFSFPNNSNGLVFTIADLTIRRGYRGVDAGRFNTVTLRGLVIRDNGIGSGAGVFTNASSVTIVDSVIRDNTASDAFFGCDASGGSGGGIASLCGGGSFAILNSAIVNNKARAGGGAVFVNGQQTIVNSTFSGNTALDPNGIGGAIMSFADGIFINNSTIAANVTRPGGGALFFGSAVATMKASVLDLNDGGNCLIGGPLTSEGYNVSSDASCALAGPNDASMVSARLKPLEDNGGNTLTHALKGNSPARDRLPLSLCGLATDQRGKPRGLGDACDSGAFEKPQ
jgi:hypothetical protein